MSSIRRWRQQAKANTNRMSQTLKAAQIDCRVRTDNAIRNAYSRFAGTAEVSPAGAVFIHYDIYGRPANQASLPAPTGDVSAAGHWYGVHRRIAIENADRPYTYHCAGTGNRCGRDFMAKGRDGHPLNLTGDGKANDFVKFPPPPQAVHSCSASCGHHHKKQVSMKALGHNYVG